MHENRWSPYGSKRVLARHVHGWYCKEGGKTGSRSFRWISNRKCVFGMRFDSIRLDRLKSGMLVSGDNKDGRRTDISGASSCGSSFLTAV